MKISSYIHLHFFELKYNLFVFLITYCYLFLILYIFSNQLVFIFTKILITKNMLKYLIFTNITEIFYTNINLAFLISFIIMSQLFFIQMWIFLSKGLFKYENLKILKLFFYFISFNILIFFIIFIKIIPNIWLFFININISENFLLNIYFEPKINNYFNFIIELSIYIYLILFYFYVFFIYILTFFSSIKTIILFRHIFYLKFLLISLLITPPDLNSQFFYFINLIFCFECLLYIYIQITQYFQKKK
jgi:sec-independent protein translocase protein TatC